MKKLSIFTFAFLICFLFTASYAGDIKKESKYHDSYLKPSKLTQISAQYFNPLTHNLSLTLQDTLSKEQQLAQLPGYKLPKRALFFSALIPGAGELYTKSYIKAGVFFLVEAASWAIYGNYSGKGKDEEKNYQNYADAHWSADVWNSWYENYQGEITDAHASTMEKYLGGDESATTKQQYYEMIGKYPAFYVGWDFVKYEDNRDFFDTINMDSLESVQQSSSLIGEYMDMRDKSNKFFRIARSATNFIIINHILSAIDAAWTAKRHNNRLIEASIRYEQIYFVDHLQPVLSLKIRW
jgi:TM2 domain-containing membrane protein YozV